MLTLITKTTKRELVFSWWFGQVEQEKSEVEEAGRPLDVNNPTVTGDRIVCGVS